MSISEQSVGAPAISEATETRDTRSPLKRRFVSVADRQAEPEAR